MRWKENKLFTIKLRNGKYVLLQMLAKKGKIIAFNVFSDTNMFDVELSKKDVLFVTHVSFRSLIKNCEVCLVKDVSPLLGVEAPVFKISSGHQTRIITLWKGTEHERELLVIGDGNNLLVEKRELEELSTPISLNDYEKYKEFEMNALRVFPEFNERLLLCYKLKKNIDPSKEIAFNRELDPICGTYIDIISGKVRLSELGYPGLGN